MQARMVRPDYKDNSTNKKVCLDELAKDLQKTLGASATLEACKVMVKAFFK